MTPGFQLGVEQTAIHFHFKTSTMKRHQSDVLNFGLEITQQFLNQAYSPVSIVSNSTISDLNIESHIVFLVVLDWLKIIT